MGDEIQENMMHHILESFITSSPNGDHLHRDAPDFGFSNGRECRCSARQASALISLSASF